VNAQRPIIQSWISTSLIAHLRFLYDRALTDSAGGFGVRHGINGFTHHAIPAYIVAVAAVEAFLNETCLAPSTKQIAGASPLWSIPEDVLERMDLREKLILVPKMLFGRTFERGAPPFQDFATLVKVRNDMVHYRMISRLPKYLPDLEQKGVALISHHAAINGADYDWPGKLQSTEGIRWAHNAACAVMVGLMGHMSASRRRGAVNLRGLIRTGRLRSYLRPITEAHARAAFKEHGVDPDSDHPPKRSAEPPARESGESEPDSGP
jgi:hypothetical protein